MNRHDHGGKWAVVVAACLALGGCGGGSKLLKANSVAQVKTVAIVNITSHNKMKSGGTGRGNGVAGIMNTVNDVKSLASGAGDAQYRAQMESIYDALADKIAAAGFVTTKRADLAANANFPPTYQKLTRIDIGGDPGAFVVNGGHFNLRKMEDRLAVLDALGVDAVGTVEITYTVGKTGGASIGGFGALKRYPKASVDFFLYDRTNRDPIWADYRCTGETASDGFQETMGVKDTKDPGPIFLEAADTAFTKLLARFQDARGPVAK